MSWRSKFVFLLIVYFAGFATAIYCLAPAPEGASSGTGQKSALFAKFKSDEFATSVNSGMHKCIDLGKDAAREAARLIQEKMEETQLKTTN